MHRENVRLVDHVVASSIGPARITGPLVQGMSGFIPKRRSYSAAAPASSTLVGSYAYHRTCRSPTITLMRANLTANDSAD
jgi:hypothetical protein